MKLRRWTAAVLLFVLMAGCAVPAGQDTGTKELTASSEAMRTERPEIELPTLPDTEPISTGAAPPATEPLAPEAPAASGTEPGPTVTVPPTSEPTVTEPLVTESTPDRPAVLSLGLYEGPYPEDGTDDNVDSVAVILVENRSDVQLQFAELHYTIDGREANFRVSELPPGARAMVLETNRLIATPVSVWEAQPDGDLTVYLAAKPEDRLELLCDTDGKLTAVNRGTEKADFDLIYKRKNDEGVFVGGIAYHLRIEALAPGETRTLDAPHYSATHSVPVRVTATVVS